MEVKKNLRKKTNISLIWSKWLEKEVIVLFIWHRVQTQVLKYAQARTRIEQLLQIPNEIYGSSNSKPQTPDPISMHF